MFVWRGLSLYWFFIAESSRNTPPGMEEMMALPAPKWCPSAAGSPNRKKGKWGLLKHQYMEWKRKTPTRKKASRRSIMIGHLFNKRKVKHISSLKIKLKHTAVMRLAVSEPGPVWPSCSHPGRPH